VIEDLLLHNPVSVRITRQCLCLTHFNTQSITGRDIGVIAPYAAQIKLLDRLLKIDAAYREHFINILGRHRAQETLEIEVKTVDGFEGREKEIIVFSTVRNNSNGNIGFLADRRRLNVGLTRAKRGLFIIGNMFTLREGKVGFFQNINDAARSRPNPYSEMEGQVWRRFIDYMEAQHSIKTLHGTQLAIRPTLKSAM
jgi:regulator of nonsense transcripts 1